MANIQQWTCHGGPAQQWRVEPLGGGVVQMVNVNSGKCLDVAYLSTENGANVNQYSCSRGTHQQWRIRPLR
jgi:hypothetical protein